MTLIKELILNYHWLLILIILINMYKDWKRVFREDQMDFRDDSFGLGKKGVALVFFQFLDHFLKQVQKAKETWKGLQVN